MFNPHLEIGEEINNTSLCNIFKCSSQGGMRKSNEKNALVIVADYTKGIYHDKWIAGVLHYTGMGLSGVQDINYKQNRTLNESGNNGVDVHLFEVMQPNVYTYCGRVQLVGKPYTEIQPDKHGIDRKVWIFPVQPVPDNDVAKPKMYVYKDMEDYKMRGKNVDAEYAKIMAAKKKYEYKASDASQVIPTSKSKLEVVIPQDIIGKKVKHSTFGVGTIIGINDSSINVDFEKKGEKKIDYEFCMKKNMLEFI